MRSASNALKQPQRLLLPLPQHQVRQHRLLHQLLRLPQRLWLRPWLRQQQWHLHLHRQRLQGLPGLLLPL
jgi:hypothetical protein